MVSVSKKQKHVNKSHPSTSTFSKPSMSSSNFISAYSPDGTQFAYVSLAIDKHRLRVYDTSTGRAIANYTAPGQLVTSLRWLEYAAVVGENDEDLGTGQAQDSTSRKRRKKDTTSDAPPASQHTVVGLGFSNGTITLFSPIRGSVIGVLSDATSTAPVLALTQAGASNSTNLDILWSSSADGVVRTWSLNSLKQVDSWKADDSIPFNSISVRPGITDQLDSQAHILVANHSIKLLATPLATTVSSKLSTLSTFTGHASSIIDLQWLPGSTVGSLPTRFVSIAQGDRIAYVWETPSADEASTEGKIVASIPLDSDITQVATPKTDSPELPQPILLLSSSGVVSIFTLSAKVGSSSKKNKIASLTPKSTVSVASKSTASNTHGDEAVIIAAHLTDAAPGQVKIVRLVGVRPVFDTLKFINEENQYIAEVKAALRTDLEGLPAEGFDDLAVPPNHRYVERPELAMRSGVELGESTQVDGSTVAPDGNLDVNLAELSLGQRLKGMTQDTNATDKNTEDSALSITSLGLTRTLTQALHSSDTQLLETCFLHSDINLIRDSVRNLPLQLVVPLINALVERLSRGGRAGSGKGGGGGASTQKGMTLVTWVRVVLLLHTAYLLTVPDLVSRLSALHATLNSRSMLQERLLNLSGRLDLVLSQMDMKASAQPSRTRIYKKGGHHKHLTRYVEGESSEDDEADDRDSDDAAMVEVESGDDQGSVEDVELRGESQDESDDDDDEEDSEEDSEAGLNGFIDDEAEENWEEDESEDSEE